jgi:hypothetical protein
MQSASRLCSRRGRRPSLKESGHRRRRAFARPMRWHSAARQGLKGLCQSASGAGSISVAAPSGRMPSLKYYGAGACSAKRGKSPSCGPLVESLDPADVYVQDVRFRRQSASRCSVRGAVRFDRRTTVHTRHEQRSKPARPASFGTERTRKSAAKRLAD